MSKAEIWFDRLLLWGCLFCLYYSQILAQTRVFDHYGPKEGLVTSQVLCISKDNHGYLWLGTENGLARFDAHSFRYYHHNYKDTQTLSSNYISRIQCDNHNRIWINSGSNLNILDITTGKILRYTDQNFKINSTKITQFYYDQKHDTMWILSQSGIFFNTGRNISIQKKIFPSVEGRIIEIFKWSNNRYILAGDKALYVYDAHKRTTKVYHQPNHNVNRDDGFQCIYADNDSIIWAGLWESGLFMLNVNTGESRNFYYDDPTKIQNGINDIQKIKKGDEDLFLATMSGIITFNIKKKSFTRYTSDNIFNPYGITGEGFSLFTDNHSIWIGTNSGLHKYDLFKNFIKSIDLNLNNTINKFKPQDICFEKNSNTRDSIAWVSFAYNGIYRYDLINQEQISMPNSLVTLLENKITGPYKMMIDRRNIFWISAEKQPLIIFDLKNNIMLKYQLPETFRGVALSINEDESGAIWLATPNSWYKGIRQGNKFLFTEPKEISAKINNEYPDIAPVPYLFTLDLKSNIWFIGYGGKNKIQMLFYYDFQRKMLYCMDEYKFPEIKALGWINGMFMTSRQELMIYGRSGFGYIRNDAGKFKFTPYSKIATITLINSEFAVEDYTGNIVFSNDNGISYLNRESSILSKFSRYNSSVGNTVLPGIYLSTNNHRVYLSQKGSIAFFDPEKLNISAPGKIYVTEISISGYQPTNEIQSGDIIHLHHYQNQIQLSVSNLFYTNSDYSNYFYRWSEKDEWKRNPNNHFNFSNLSTGQYKLQIKSSNSFGVIGKDIFTLGVIISPPFYKTWWFYLILSILSISGIYWIFRNKEQQRLRLEHLRHQIAKDLHDDLGSSLSYIRILSESEARKTSKSISFKNISDKTAEIMNNMSEIIWSINPMYDSFNNVVTRLQDFAIDTLEPFGINLKFNIENLPEKLKLSPEKRRQYYLIFKEAINNAAKYSNSESIILTIRYENKHIITILEDFGIGFDNQLIHKGNGLKNMKSRADLLGSKLTIKTNEQGTKVFLSMKG
jgi:ligand-binding sensor domain-containing protein